MKKFLALLLAMAMVLSLAACGEKKETPAETPAEEPAASAVKIGLICVHDINSGYDAAHIEGLTAACEELGIDVDSQVVFKYNIPEDETCADTAVDLAEQGCTIIFSDFLRPPDAYAVCRRGISRCHLRLLHRRSGRLFRPFQLQEHLPLYI